MELIASISGLRNNQRRARSFANDGRIWRLLAELPQFAPVVFTGLKAGQDRTGRVAARNLHIFKSSLMDTHRNSDLLKGKDVIVEGFICHPGSGQ